MQICSPFLFRLYCLATGSQTDLSSPVYFFFAFLPFFGFGLAEFFRLGEARSGTDSTEESELSPTATERFLANRRVLGVTTSRAQKS